eukprot:scaffold98215_cov54-Phaeocystis_antarctica.AAC.2
MERGHLLAQCTHVPVPPVDVGIRNLQPGEGTLHLPWGGRPRRTRRGGLDMPTLRRAWVEARLVGGAVPRVEARHRAIHKGVALLRMVRQPLVLPPHTRRRLPLALPPRRRRPAAARAERARQAGGGGARPA